MIGILEMDDRQHWREWLREHHDTKTGIWLVFRKRGAPSIGYEDAVAEALCFGWVDSLVKRLDDDRYARKFTPRKPDSKWSTINRRRYAELQALGLLEASGLARAPGPRSGDRPAHPSSAIPAYIEQKVRAAPSAWEFFTKLAPSYRRRYIGWIDSAKREETRQKRLAEAIRLLASGQKLGLK